MKDLKKDLQGVSTEFDALAKKATKLRDELKKKAADQLEKARTVVTRETAARKTVAALKSLTKTMDKLTKTVAKFEKAQVAAKKKAAAKPRTAKKSPARKKAVKVTATDQVVKIVKRSKKGVDIATLVKKTGFEDKKIRNILFRASKQGKIKKAGRGSYIGA